MGSSAPARWRACWSRAESPRPRWRCSSWARTAGAASPRSRAPCRAKTHGGSACGSTSWRADRGPARQKKEPAPRPGLAPLWKGSVGPGAAFFPLVERIVGRTCHGRNPRSPLQAASLRGWANTCRHPPRPASRARPARTAGRPALGTLNPVTPGARTTTRTRSSRCAATCTATSTTRWWTTTRWRSGATSSTSPSTSLGGDRAARPGGHRALPERCGAGDLRGPQAQEGDGAGRQHPGACGPHPSAALSREQSCGRCGDSGDHLGLDRKSECNLSLTIKAGGDFIHDSYEIAN